MRWNPFRSRGRSDVETPAPPGKPSTDRVTMAIRQRRMFTAQQRVDQLPGFGKLERRWCDPPVADELDARVADANGPVQQWSEAALLEALPAAASAAVGGAGFALVLDEPEARWVEAPLGDLLSAAAAALPHLRAGVIVLADGRGLHIGALTEVDGARGREVALQGEWSLPTR